VIYLYFTDPVEKKDLEHTIWQPFFWGGIVSLGEGEISPPPKKGCRERTVTVGWLLQNPRASHSQVSDVLLARHRSRLLQHSLRRRRTLQPAALPHQLFMYYVHSVAAFSFLPAPRNNTGPVITPAASSGKGVRHRSGVRPSVCLSVPRGMILKITRQRAAPRRLALRIDASARVPIYFFTSAVL